MISCLVAFLAKFLRRKCVARFRGKGGKAIARAMTIYKITPRSLWQAAEASGRFTGAPVDEDDGFIHFSTAQQVKETAGKHFAGQDDLLLIAIDETALDDQLRYEPSRGGALFPHLYAPLPLSAVSWVKPLPLQTDGSHAFPDLDAS
jgi:uncharacterized protein (DUF952 family)